MDFILQDVDKSLVTVAFDFAREHIVFIPHIRYDATDQVSLFALTWLGVSIAACW